jgi:hypothetical protein
MKWQMRARPTSKVQQLLITLLLLGAYAGIMISAIVNKENFDALPSLSASFVGLLAISHAGYLTYKAMPKPAPDGTRQAPLVAASTNAGSAAATNSPSAAATPRPS